MKIIIALLFMHWVSDFALQPHWMSMRKSKEWGVLAGHALIIGSVLAFGVAAFLQLNFRDAMLFAAVNAVAHFMIDAVTSRITSRLYAKNRIHDFFVVIGFDQFLHVALLVWTWDIIKGLA